jgi:4'-phosphopantetheinyl transferase EntD
MPGIFSIASLVPGSAVVAELTGCRIGQLLPEEEAALGKVSHTRRRDFTLGRECARQALSRLGLEARPILPAATRAPLWPAEICGSITHCEGYAAAAVARKADIRAIGIDAECRQDLADGILERIAGLDEREWIRKADPQIPWGLILFSAKESVFKAWFPLIETWLEFKDLRLEFDPATTTFRAILLRRVSSFDEAVELTGRYHVDDQFVRTSAFMPVPPPRSRSSPSE